MREAILAVMTFDELSPKAQEVVFDRWQRDNSDMDFSLSGELKQIFNVVEENAGVTLSDYEYSPCGYSYNIDTRAENYELDDKDVCGVRAGKIALRMYYDITEKRQVFGKQTRYVVDSPKFSHLNIEYKGLADKYRVSAVIKSDACFTGVYSSQTFSMALMSSIRDNYTNEDYTVANHLEAAFDALFAEAVEEWGYQSSREYFEENRSDDFEYLADGTIFDFAEIEDEA